MNNFDHNLHIIETAEWLGMLQHDGQHVMINLKTDEATQTQSHYYGAVERIVIDVPEPFVDIQAETLVIAYLSQAHRDARELFNVLRAAREAVAPSESTSESLVQDLDLGSAIDKELSVAHDEYTIELGGTPQRIAITAIHSTFGIERP